MSSKKEYCLVDVAKFFFSICIIALHSEILVYINHAQISWAATILVFRQAVPFFFVASGFFLAESSHFFETGKLSARSTKKYVLRLFRYLAIFEPINIVLQVISVLMASPDVSFSELGQMILRSVLFYPYGALWYIQACIVAAILLYFAINKLKLPLSGI